MTHTQAVFSSFLIAVGLLGPFARASDGTLEINQQAALAGGVTGSLSDDPAGFPVRIRQSGSYRLTGNLDLTTQSVNTSAIAIEASNVSIDLNGFAILGPVTCSGAPVTSCSATQFGIGISSTSAFRNITVENGSVRGMALGGIILSGPDSRVENVHATGNGQAGVATLRTGTFVHVTATANGGNGIDAGDDSVITGAVVRDNQLDGIHCGIGCSIGGSSASQNGQDGIETQGAATVTQSSARGNGNRGIATGASSTVSQNSAQGNQDDGIQVGATSTVTGNTASGNTGPQSDGIFALSGSTISGNNASGNGDDGIDVPGNSTVIGNTARSNTNYGIELAASDAYGENVLSGNNAAAAGDPRCIQVSNTSAPELTPNACNGVVCYCTGQLPPGSANAPRGFVDLIQILPHTCN